MSVARAVEKRRREFTAGRIAARRALALLGVESFPLVIGPDRVPVWPEGIAGSISHCEGFCGVAVVRIGAILSVGLDVERAEPLEDDIAARVASPRELDQAARFPEGERRLVSKLLFSAKESAFKGWYPLGRKLLDFHDVEVALDPGAHAFTARFLRGGGRLPAGLVLEGRYAEGAGHVFTGVTLRS